MSDPPLQPAAALRPLAPPRVVRKLPVIPERYALREKDGARFIECDEAPRLRVFIDPSMSVSRADASALGERTILLDGAGSFGPLIDTQHDLYNLDHHAGCERLFTLSTCEQALLMVHSGLALSEGDWTVHANAPDLDTVLAIWCLLNHRRLLDLRPEAQEVLFPLLRLEGAIDANGRELALLCGLPAATIEETQRRIDDLLAHERALKQTTADTRDPRAFTVEMLRAVDMLVYRGEDFGDYTRIEEVVGHVEIAPGRAAVVCRDPSGIYTVEQHLKARWGDQLSLIALENEPGQYTLRRVGNITGAELEPAYDLLNRIDRAVDGRPPGKQWGGSAEIGGSPRPHGTRLTVDEILEALPEAYRPISWLARAGRALGAFAIGASSLLFWPLGLIAASAAPLTFAASASVAAAYPVALAALGVFAVGALLTRAMSRRRPWTFGWRLPANGGGWWLLPLLLLGALPVALVTPPWMGSGAGALASALVAGALGVAAQEVWLRGLVHGVASRGAALQTPRGGWALSRPAWVSAAAYSLVATVLAGPAAAEVLATFQVPMLEALAGFAVLTLVVGLGLAVIRERSLSLLPGIGIQLLGILVAGGLSLL